MFGFNYIPSSTYIICIFEQRLSLRSSHTYDKYCFMRTGPDCDHHIMGMTLYSKKFVLSMCTYAVLSLSVAPRNTMKKCSATRSDSDGSNGFPGSAGQDPDSH